MLQDHELLARWRGGDQAAGSELFDRHFDSLRRFFRTKVEISEVEDLMQRTMLACVESVPKFRGDSSFRTFLFVIARRELYDFIHRKVRRFEREAPDLGVSSIHDLGLTPSMKVAEHEREALLAQAMQRIPIDFQVTLELFYWEQLRGPELAEILGISPATVRTRLHRARSALLEILREHAPDLGFGEAELDESVEALGRSRATV